MKVTAIAIQTSKSLLLDIIETDSAIEMAEKIIEQLEFEPGESIIEVICHVHGGDRTFEHEVEHALYSAAPQLFSTGYEWSEPR